MSTDHPKPDPEEKPEETPATPPPFDVEKYDETIAKKEGGLDTGFTLDEGDTPPKPS